MALRRPAGLRTREERGRRWRRTARAGGKTGLRTEKWEGGGKIELTAEGEREGENVGPCLRVMDLSIHTVAGR